MATTTTKTKNQTQDDAQITLEILQALEKKMALLQRTEDLARQVGQKNRQHHAHLARDCLEWASTYILHGRLDEAEQALQEAKKHWEALA